MKNGTQKFEVIVLGIILDPQTKKVLIGKREDGPDADLLGWCFPGGRVIPEEGIDQSLKQKIKLKTGYSVKNIGTYFSQTHKEHPGLISISFLTRVFEGEEQPGGDIVELKWVDIAKLGNYFKVPMHKKLKDFLSELI